MTASVLKKWSALVRKAAREGWSSKRLDSEIARVAR